MGLNNGTLALLILFGLTTLTRSALLLAAAVAGNYFVAMALTPLLRGTAWMEPEFVACTPRPLGLAPQQLITYVLCVVVPLAVVLAVAA